MKAYKVIEVLGDFVASTRRKIESALPKRSHDNLIDSHDSIIDQIPGEKKKKNLADWIGLKSDIKSRPDVHVKKKKQNRFK